ncbi:hypothetical protein LH462_00330 [Laribacter hongkongensis]|jgi:hypothetical protein|nr:hypothetical protein [Laribacter hongkongensis]MBE5530206.1 hypothetical protein [Laribacter hongkongensis]MCG8992087.1 hypothetical protein [Laribacter hongkongensis]MCG8994073.1 hypothetical protein [Laribacter hongkongensis]MCG8998614.1 hypothetical protein [Laribacter hongkongensis]MCG9002144.1 hypothetical protein [Laribacter hongkongensis]
MTRSESLSLAASLLGGALTSSDLARQTDAQLADRLFALAEAIERRAARAAGNPATSRSSVKLGGLLSAIH